MVLPIAVVYILLTNILSVLMIISSCYVIFLIKTKKQIYENLSIYVKQIKDQKENNNNNKSFNTIEYIYECIYLIAIFHIIYN